MADEEQSRGPEEESGGPEELRQHPFVGRLRPEPSQPPERVRVLEGLLGNSDREGYKRLYFTRELDYYAEFRIEDVVYSEPIPPDHPPLVGLDGTRVGIRWDAPIEFTRVRTPRPVDEFDLDVRLAASRRGLEAMRAYKDTHGDDCDPCTGDGTTCPGVTEGETCGYSCWATCPGNYTCQTCAGQETCGGHTCQTCAGQQTCGGHTCNDNVHTCGGQETCETCYGPECPVLQR
jgi:hypothetical protein